MDAYLVPNQGDGSMVDGVGLERSGDEADVNKERDGSYDKGATWTDGSWMDSGSGMERRKRRTEEKENTPAGGIDENWLRRLWLVCIPCIERGGSE